MRISIILLIFLILFNGVGGLMQTYDIDDHMGIGVNTGSAPELEQATQNAQSIRTGESIGGTLLGFYNGILNTVKGVMLGIQPGVQLLVNVAPAGLVEDFIIWAFSIIPILIFADLVAIARGVDL